MKRTIYITVLILIALQSQAQFLRADYKKAEITYHRPLIVALLDLSDAVNACDSLHMNRYNEMVREIVPKYWTLNDSIIFMEKRMLTSIIGSRSPEYAVLKGQPSLEGQQSSNDIYWSRSFTIMLFLSEDGQRLDPEMVDRNSPLIPDTDMGGQLLRGRYIFKLSFVNYQLSTGDLIFVVSQFNNSVNLALERRYSKKGVYAQKVPKGITYILKSKTLLIPDNLYEEGVDENIIAKYYDHPFRIASQEEIANAILIQEENMAYIHYLWSDAERMFLGNVIDTKSGELMAVLKSNVVKLEKTECLDIDIAYRTLIRMQPKRLKSLSRMVK